MSQRITILHISDLHRDPAGPISNAALMDSLERDRDRYVQESPPIDSPDVIVVSGDIVHGVSPTNRNGPDELARQYDQAEDFLVSLADRFVGGDRKRVVIVPGNHDVSFYHVAKSLKRIELDLSNPALIRSYVKELNAPGSQIRWVWEDLSFYEISDTDLYANRLGAFATFYERFYRSQRQYSLSPERQFAIFDYPQFAVTIVGLNSCCNNDPYNAVGTIHPDCIAGSGDDLRDLRFQRRVVLATWHHNTSGSPDDSDYMHAETLQLLIDQGVSLVMHGHQHRPQFISEHFHFGAKKKLTVISAGSLCSGPTGLPSGHARGYNIIDLDTDACKGRLHQRRMLNNDFRSPIWGPGYFPSSPTSFLDFEIQPPELESSDEHCIGDVRELMQNKRYEEAAKQLRPSARRCPIARRLLLECYVSLSAYRAIVKDFNPPTGPEEIVSLADALFQEKEMDLLQALLASHAVSQSSDPAVYERRQRYSAPVSE